MFAVMSCNLSFIFYRPMICKTNKKYCPALGVYSTLIPTDIAVSLWLVSWKCEPWHEPIRDIVSVSPKTFLIIRFMVPELCLIINWKMAKFWCHALNSASQMLWIFYTMFLPQCTCQVQFWQFPSYAFVYLSWSRGHSYSLNTFLHFFIQKSKELYNNFWPK